MARPRVLLPGVHDRPDRHSQADFLSEVRVRMTYKGDDRDLRTPSGAARPSFVAAPASTAATSNAWLSRALSEADDSPSIWVDDTTLAVCNQAFDLAVIMGAAEVGLEHLVHAMTQIEAASDILYEHNIHLSTLRRESTAIIMEDFPASRAEGKSAPLKSAEFEDVLYHAADRAHARRSPVTIEDILDTLFDMSRDNASRRLLARHRTDFNLRESMEPTQQHGAVNEGRQKIRVSAGSHQMGNQSMADTNRMHEPPSVTDTLQNTRIDAIERAIRELTDDIALNRKSFASLIDELRGETRLPETPAYTSPRPVNGIYDDPNVNDVHEVLYLLGRVERSVDAKFNELARSWSVLGDRLSALENAVEAIETAGGGFELTPEVEARLKTLSFADDRLDKLETMLVSLPQRLSEMERRIQHATSAAQSTIDTSVLEGKLDRIERMIEESPDGNFEPGPLMGALRDVETSLRTIAGQVRDVENRTSDVNLVVEGLNERQERIERAISDNQGYLGDVQARLDEVVGVVRTEINEIGNALLGQSDGGERIQGLVENSLRGVSENFERHRDSISESVNAVVSDRFAGLAGIVQTRQAETAQGLQQIQARMSAFEARLEGLLDRPVNVNGSGDVDVSYLHDAVGKIINNQHTLAGSIDDWRAQVSQDVSLVASRLEKLEDQGGSESVIPIDRFDEIHERMDRLQTTLSERQDGWSRFTLWLYGTTDWYGASWGDDRDDDTPDWVARDSRPPRNDIDDRIPGPSDQRA
jgi:hypothetical protein